MNKKVWLTLLCLYAFNGIFYVMQWLKIISYTNFRPIFCLKWTIGLRLLFCRLHQFGESWTCYSGEQHFLTLTISTITIQIIQITTAASVEFLLSLNKNLFARQKGHAIGLTSLLPIQSLPKKKYLYKALDYFITVSKSRENDNNYSKYKRPIGYIAYLGNKPARLYRHQ